MCVRARTGRFMSGSENSKIIYLSLCASDCHGDQFHLRTSTAVAGGGAVTNTTPERIHFSAGAAACLSSSGGGRGGFFSSKALAFTLAYAQSMRCCLSSGSTSYHSVPSLSLKV